MPGHGDQAAGKPRHAERLGEGCRPADQQIRAHGIEGLLLGPGEQPARHEAGGAELVVAAAAQHGGVSGPGDDPHTV